MRKPLVQVTFDYSALQSTDALEVRMAAERIRTRLKRTAEDIVAIGQDLLAAKERLGHGKFGDWLAAEFEMSQPTAENFMRVAERFGGEIVNITNLSASVLYLLAAPSTPDVVVAQVTSGAIPATAEAIKAAKAEARQARDDAEEARRELRAAQASAGEIDLQRRRAEGEVAQVRKHLELLREEMATPPAPDMVREYIQVVPEKPPLAPIAHAARQVLEGWYEAFEDFQGERLFQPFAAVYEAIEKLLG